MHMTSVYRPAMAAMADHAAILGRSTGSDKLLLDSIFVTEQRPAGIAACRWPSVPALAVNSLRRPFKGRKVCFEAARAWP